MESLLRVKHPYGYRLRQSPQVSVLQRTVFCGPEFFCRVLLLFSGVVRGCRLDTLFGLFRAPRQFGNRNLANSCFLVRARSRIRVILDRYFYLEANSEHEASFLSRGITNKPLTSRERSAADAAFDFEVIHRRPVNLVSSILAQVSNERS